MAAKKSDSAYTLEDTSKSSLDSKLYTFKLTTISGTTKIGSHDYFQYHVSITPVDGGTTYYLTCSSGQPALTSSLSQAGTFVIYEADVYDNNRDTSSNRLCLFAISSTQHGGTVADAVEFDTDNNNYHYLNLCRQRTITGEWTVCKDAYDLGVEGVLVADSYNVEITKVSKDSDNRTIDNAANLRLFLKKAGESTATELTKGSDGKYTLTGLEAGTYYLTETGAEITNYELTGSTLEGTKTDANLTITLQSETSTHFSLIDIGAAIIGAIKDKLTGDDTSTTATDPTPITVKYTLTNTYTKKEDPKATSATKEVVLKSADGTYSPALPTGYTPDNSITFPANKTDALLITGNSVTLLYKITVTGDANADFTVTDADTTKAYGTVTAGENGTYTGKLDDNGSCVFYVTKTFNAPFPESKKLTNDVTLEGGQGGKEEIPYTTPAKITITKVFTDGTNPLSKPENFKIKVDGNEVTKKDGDGYVYEVALNPGEHIISEESYAITHYKRTSVDFKDSSNTAITAETDGSYKITVVGGTDASYTLTNTYSKDAATPATFNPGLYITKKLTGANLPNEVTFEVSVTKQGDQTGKTGSATIQNVGTQNFSFTAENQFTLSTETIYEVQEVVPTNKINGLDYDSIKYELKVTLKSEPNTNNELEIDYVSYKKSTDTEWTKLTGDDKLEITNTYTAPRTTAEVTLTKNYAGVPAGTKAEGLTTITLTKDGTNYTFTRQTDGTYKCGTALAAGTYTVSETTEAAKIDGYTWQKVEPAEVTVTADHVKTGTINFTLTNTYEENEKTPATVNFSDLIQKKLTIKGDYSFTGETFTAWLYYDSPSKLSLMIPDDATFYKLKATFGENDKNGTVKDFLYNNGDLVIEFPDAKQYHFILQEDTDSPKSNVTYDKSVYSILVNVEADRDGTLYVDYITYQKWDDGKIEGTPDNHGQLYNGTNIVETIIFKNTVNTGYKSNDHIKIDSPNKLNTDDHYAYIIGYPDGTVQPNGEITRAEVATIFFRLLKDDVREKYFTKTNDFSDVSRDDWFNNPVSTMAELGIVKGYPDGTFRPNEPITRAEFAAIAARFDESSRYGETRFTDVAGHWAIREIAKAYNNGWIKGYPDNTFRPNRNITRAEAMTLINRVLNRAPETEKDLLSNMNKWSDNMDVDAWYYLAVQEATNSHDYRRKSSSYEHWIRMLEDPNWAKYER